MNRPEHKGLDDDAQAKHLPTSSLLDILTPPAGYVVDRALCSAYSGQCAVLVAMLAAMVRQGTADGKGSSSLALVRALQRLQDRVHFLVQHGRLVGPRSASPILNILDRFVVPVKYDERSASWHPKVCIVRCTSRGSPDAKAFWRLWIGSRNFTRDESWDMALALTGEAGGKGEKIPDVIELTRRLAAEADVQPNWQEALQELCEVKWQVPAGLRIDKLALFKQGDLQRNLQPAPKDARSILAVSPFLDGWAVSQLLKDHPANPAPRSTKPRLISTWMCMSEVARHHRAVLSRYDLRVLPASDQDDQEDDDVDAEAHSLDADADATEGRGLHAKFIWIETPKRGELRLGSTNLTERGWKRNAEVLVIASVELPGSGFSEVLRSGLKAFDDLCLEHELAEEELPIDREQHLQDEFDKVRKTLVASFVAFQKLEDGVAIVALQSSPALPADARLRVGRIGDTLTPWKPGATEIVLPTAPAHENGDLIRMELVIGELRSEWLQHAPFNPSLSRVERDIPLLHAYLGIDGVISLLNDSLTAGGNGGGERRKWNKQHPQGNTSGMIALLGIEAVLGSWVRDAESLPEIQRIVDIARRCKPTSEKEKKTYQQLQAFLLSWDAVEQELVKQ
jgi:hypothetical protein